MASRCTVAGSAERRIGAWRGSLRGSAHVYPPQVVVVTLRPIWSTVVRYKAHTTATSVAALCSAERADSDRRLHDRTESAAKGVGGTFRSASIGGSTRHRWRGARNH